MVSFMLRLFMTFCVAVTFFMTAYTIFIVGPAIEARYMPVVSKLTITDISVDESGNAVVLAEFTKRRECEYLGLAWYRGQPTGGFERVSLILLRQDGDTSSPNRPPGTQRSGPWIIGMTPDEVLTNSFALLSHRCHAFWVTTTPFFP